MVKRKHVGAMKSGAEISRRRFVAASAGVAAGLAAPPIIPASARGADGRPAPSNRIGVGMIGLGRQAISHNLPVFVRADDAEVVALCDVDRWRLAFSKENPVWAYGLVVEVVGERAGRKVMCTYRSKHPPQEEWGGESAYFKNVGIPLSIGAQIVAHGKATGKGVLPPERVLPTQLFFAELARRGILVEEEIVEEGVLTD